MKFCLLWMVSSDKEAIRTKAQSCIGEELKR